MEEDGFDADGKPFVFDFFQPASKAAEASASPAKVDAQKHFCTDCGRAFSTKQHATRCKCGTGPGSGGVRAGAGSGGVRAGAGSGAGGVRAGAAEASASPAKVDAQKHFCTDCGRAFSTKQHATRCKCGTGPGSGGVRAGAGRPRIHPLALEAAGVKTALEGS